MNEQQLPVGDMMCPAWPNCDQILRCARCLVLDRCLAQVPNPPEVRELAVLVPWRKRYGYPAPSDRLVLRIAHARQVSDRLIAWLVWPGEPCNDCAGCATLPDGMPPLDGCIDPRHPLDGSPAGELQVQKPCPGCDGAGETRETALDRTPGGLILYCCQTGMVTDWPVVAVICDVLEEHGAWATVHVWRP